MGRFKEWKDNILENKGKILISLLFLIIASILDYISGNYVRTAKVVTAPDLILDYIPPINLSFIFVWFYLAVFFIIILYPLISKPKKIHYFLGLISSFILVRGIFIIFTHLKTPVEAIPATFPLIFQFLRFENDMFFSGHTGLPFLAFLMFRKENKILAYFMLFSSIIMAITVLLMHQHYSIDVFAAFFITYGVYKIGDRIFNRKSS